MYRDEQRDKNSARAPRNQGGISALPADGRRVDFHANDQRGTTASAFLSAAIYIYVYISALHFFLDKVALTRARKAEGEGEGERKSGSACQLFQTKRERLGYAVGMYVDTSTRGNFIER